MLCTRVRLGASVHYVWVRVSSSGLAGAPAHLCPREEFGSASVVWVVLAVVVPGLSWEMFLLFLVA